MQLATKDHALPGQAPQAALVVAAGIGSGVGSLNSSSTRSARLGAAPAELGEGLRQGGQAKIAFALGPVQPVQKRRQVY